MIPEPSRRGFFYPLPVEALAYFVRPGAGHPLSLPFRDCHGNIVTWNGALGVRIRSVLPDIELSEVPFEAVENSLPWPEEEEAEDAERWRLLDDVSGAIWRFPPKAVWIELARGEITGNVLSSVQVGAGAVVPLALLQLVSRLPRCRVCIDNQADGPLRFIWNGGEAVIRAIRDLPSPAFGIFKSQRHLSHR